MEGFEQSSATCCSRRTGNYYLGSVPISEEKIKGRLCNFMVVYMPMLSAGACMELFYAKRKGKKVIVVSALDCLSP